MATPEEVKVIIQKLVVGLYNTMPLLGIDHWVDLGKLYVDVNILEEINSSRKSELDDLWQDFIAGVEKHSRSDGSADKSTS